MRKDARYRYLSAVHLHLKFGPLLVFSTKLPPLLVDSRNYRLRRDFPRPPGQWRREESSIHKDIHACIC